MVLTTIEQKITFMHETLLYIHGMAISGNFNFCPFCKMGKRKLDKWPNEMGKLPRNGQNSFLFHERGNFMDFT